MPDKKCSVDSDERGTYYLVKIDGIFSAKSVLDIRRTLETALEVGHNQVAIDLSGVNYIDSMGIGLIVNFQKKLETINGKLTILNPSKYADDIIEVSGTETVLTIHRNVDNPDNVMD